MPEITTPIGTPPIPHNIIRGPVIDQADSLSCSIVRELMAIVQGIEIDQAA